MTRPSVDTSGQRLVAVGGPLRGQTFTLPLGETAIGRDTDCPIACGDARLSRRHAVIINPTPEATPTLRDQGSRNGTFLNGLPVHERQLTHGDRIEVGTSTFLYLDREPETSLAKTEMRIDTDGLRVMATLEITRDRIPLITPGEGAEATAEASDKHPLARILEATRALYGTATVDQWAATLCSSLFEMLPANRVAVVLADEKSGRLDTSLGRERGSDETCTVLVDESLVDRALRESMAVLGASEDGARHVAAAPLLATDVPQGAVVVDSSQPITSPHLHLLAAVGATAAGALAHVRERAWLVGERRRLEEELHADHEMVGESAPMRRVYDMVARLAATDTTVLIFGESGTGKELVARALHANSARSERPFVALNCAAIGESLLESELFGHERGAFTGAVARKPGKLEVASGGTLLLDEVGEMSAPLQAKLLRVLETQEFERVGGTTPIRVDVRILAATNRDLEQAVRDGSFRNDLLYRLNVVRISLPPLRERHDDIALLASHFATRYARALKRPLVTISPGARERLLRHHWPGNVRELRNAIEHAVVLGNDDVLRPEDLPEHIVEMPTMPSEGSNRYHDGVRETKIRLIRQAIDEAKGSIVGAAELLGLHPNYLHRLIRNLGLRERD